jgi:Kef-type K+ transport system membrane component KefB
MKRVATIYATVLAVFVLGAATIYFVSRDLTGAAPVAQHAIAGPWSALEENLHDPLGRLLAQFIVILVATRALGGLFTRLGQPAVIGEIAAGILLGPSLLGVVLPAAFEFLFAKASLGGLQLFSQMGVCVFMFVVGLELDITNLRRCAKAAVVVSHSSIMVPFLLGGISALFLYRSFATPGTPFLTFALFMGIAMSITAFPVLVRILHDRNLARTPLGVTATSCAAMGDATAWVVLGVTVAIARAAGAISTVVNIVLLVLYVVLMLTVVRPLLASARFTTGQTRGRGAFARIGTILVFMTASALITQAIGIHALFGAFLAGVVMPRDKELRDHIVVRLENFSGVFLLPLFFAFSGLRTQINLLNSPQSWLVVVGIVALAVIGKMAGSSIPARLTGMGWRDALQLGALMNTRGLVELIALNIGYDLHILPPQIFSMLVLMALVTTFMTAPLISLARVRERPGERSTAAAR